MKGLNPSGITLVSNKDYSEIIKGLNGLPIEKQIKIYQDIYDKEIPFKEYYWGLFPQNSLRNNTPCPLHDESITGESFAIDGVRNMWQCFGKCKTVGRATQFELMWGRKENPGMSRLEALRRLHKRFPGLPKPQILQTDKLASAMSLGVVSNNIETLKPKNIILNKKSNDISVQILQAMTIEKNFNKTYK